MNKLYQRYVSLLYLKNFLVIFLGLEVFHIGVDLLSNLKSLPSSANLQLLYAYYVALMGVNFILPLSLVFAVISSKLSMIRSNELVSLYACGISRSKAIMPIFVIAMLITSLLVALNFTNFAYANEYQINILKHNKISISSTKLFVKYDNKYIYFGSLNPFKKVAYDIKIFDTDKGQLKKIISAKKAKFVQGKWFFKKATVLTMPTDKTLNAKGYTKQTLTNIFLLKRFKPNIIDNLKDDKAGLNIADALDAMFFLKKQGANVNWLKSYIYILAIFPFFAPFMVAILFFYMPPTARFFNTALLGFIFIFITLCVWGLIFVLGKFSANGVILPELAIVLPVSLMGLFALKLFYDKGNRNTD